MKNMFSLEVISSNIKTILEGDEVIVDSEKIPKGNGKDMGVFVKDGVTFISSFTRYGNTIIFIEGNGKIKVVKSTDVKVIGKVVGGSFEMETVKIG